MGGRIRSGKRMEKPSVELKGILEGRRELENATPAVRSWSRFFIYQAAEEMLAMPSKNARREAIEKVPANIRDAVKQEVFRLWELKKCKPSK